MANLLDSYEHHYSGLTAEITVKVGKIRNLTGDTKRSTCAQVEKLVEETREVLEQMELEVRGLSPDTRSKYSSRIKSYEKELANLEREYKASRTAFSDDVMRTELLENEDYTELEDQRRRLLDNTESIERSGRHLDKGYQVCVETEAIGAQIMSDLHTQRQQMNKTRERLKETDAVLGKSSRVLSGMMKRIVQNRVVLVGVFILIIAVVLIAVVASVVHRK